MQGGSAISRICPVCVARGDNGMAGLNSVGLRRAGIGSADRLVVRRAYHALFRSQDRRSKALDSLRSQLGIIPGPGELIGS